MVGCNAGLAEYACLKNLVPIHTFIEDITETLRFLMKRRERKIIIKTNLPLFLINYQEMKHLSTADVSNNHLSLRLKKHLF